MTERIIWIHSCTSCIVDCLGRQRHGYCVVTNGHVHIRSIAAAERQATYDTQQWIGLEVALTGREGYPVVSPTLENGVPPQ